MCGNAPPPSVAAVVKPADAFRWQLDVGKSDAAFSQSFQTSRTDAVGARRRVHHENFILTTPQFCCDKK